jgi:hypothetical protein
MGLQLSGPRSFVIRVNLKLCNSGLASGSMPDRYMSRVTVTINFTPLPKLASSVSFFDSAAMSESLAEIEKGSTRRRHSAGFGASATWSQPEK